MNEQAAVTAGFIGLIVWTVVRNYVLPWLVDRLRQPRPPQQVQQLTVPVQPTAAPVEQAGPWLHVPPVPSEDMAHELHLSIPFTITITPRPPGL